MKALDFNDYIRDSNKNNIGRIRNFRDTINRYVEKSTRLQHAQCICKVFRIILSYMDYVNRVICIKQ